MFMQKENPSSFFLFFILSNFVFYFYECPGLYVDIDHGIHKGKT